MNKIGVIAAVAAMASVPGACEEFVLPGPGGVAQGFTYYGPGDLAPGSGQGVEDRTVWSPSMVFPIREQPTYLNSQVYGVGGANGVGM